VQPDHEVEEINRIEIELLPKYGVRLQIPRVESGAMLLSAWITALRISSRGSARPSGAVAPIERTSPAAFRQP
jgi:hypothetical protein